MTDHRTRPAPNRTYVATLAVLCATSACSNEVSDAKRKFEFLKEQHASMGEVCDAGRAWKAAAANAQSRDYQDADIEVGGVCLDADMRGREQMFGKPDIEPDNMDVLPDDVTGNGTLSR